MWDDAPKGQEDAGADDELVEDLEVETDEEASDVKGGVMAGEQQSVEGCRTETCPSCGATCPAAYCK